MATGGLTPNQLVSGNSKSSQVMTKEDDLQMRLIYLTRRTCDQLSRDLTKYVIDKFHASNWDDWLKKNLYRLEKYKKSFKKFYGDEVPPIDKLDTTLLTQMLSDKDALRVTEKFDPYINKLRELRNKVSHDELETGLTQLNFQSELEKLDQFLVDLSNDPQSRPVFPSAKECLKLLSQNKKMTFETFCKRDPNEITTFILSLEPELRKIASTIPFLKEKLKEREKLHNKKIENIDTKLTELKCSTSTRFEDVEKAHECLEAKVENLKFNRQTSTQLPASSFRCFSISGRITEMEDFETNLVDTRLALIYGPPGIGKTAFANYYGQQIASEFNVAIEVRFSDFVLPRENPVNYIARKIGCNFPGILVGLGETEEPLSLLEHHIGAVLRDRKLLLIFDNIDTVINSDSGNEALQTVTTKLLAASNHRLKILFTARDRTFDPEPYSCLPVKLEPLSQNACEDWLLRQKSEIDEEILAEISIYCGGIPLILNILFKFVKLHGRPKEFEKIKQSDSKLKKSLELSFNKLTEDQLIIMLCAAEFTGNFENETFDSLCINVNPLYDSEKVCSLIRVCRDLCLCEYDEGKKKYYLHPYIQEFIRETYADKSQRKAVNANFVLTYFKKCLSKAREQLEEKDRFCSVVDSLLTDSQNIFKFSKLLSEDAAPMLSAAVRSDEASAYWLLTFFWLLNKIGRFKQMSSELAEKLEQIFTGSKNYAQAVICKCFLSHLFRLLRPPDIFLSKSKSKIDEAGNLLAEMQNTSIFPFCEGYLAFTKARFEQRVSSMNKSRQNFDRRKAENLFEQSLSSYSNWEKPDNLEVSLFEKMKCSENIQVLLYQYHEVLPKKNKSKKNGYFLNKREKDERFRDLYTYVDFLHDALGDHEEAAFATKKTADLLKQDRRFDKAAGYYSKAYEMYQSFGHEIETQQVMLLKEWSECLPFEEAIKKLQDAQEILIQNCLENHRWYSHIDLSLKNLKKRQKIS